MDIINSGWKDVSELEVDIPVLTIGKNSDGEWTAPKMVINPKKGFEDNLRKSKY